MKIKIIEGDICKSVYTPWSDQKFSTTTQMPEIEKKVNAFCAKHDVVSVTPTTYLAHQHNNGGYNNVRIVFTIVYNDKTE